MKVLEQTISPKKVKIEIIQKEKKKYKRISKIKLNGEQSIILVEWRRLKTNHQVKKLEHDILEAEYQEKYKTISSPDQHFDGMNMASSGSTVHHLFVTTRNGGELCSLDNYT